MARRSVLSITCGLLLATAGLAQAQQTVLNFDELPDQGWITGSYGGLSWAEGWHVFGWAQPPYTPSSGSNRVYFDYPGDAAFGLETTTAFGGASFAGFDNIFFTLFLQGNLVHTTNSIALSSAPHFLGSGYSGDVDYVVVNGTNGYYVMDDVVFGPDSVTVTPEPASMTLMATGLVAIASKRRRRRQRTGDV